MKKKHKHTRIKKEGTVRDYLQRHGIGMHWVQYEDLSKTFDRAVMPSAVLRLAVIASEERMVNRMRRVLLT